MHGVRIFEFRQCLHFSLHGLHYCHSFELLVILAQPKTKSTKNTCNRNQICTLNGKPRRSVGSFPTSNRTYEFCRVLSTVSVRLRINFSVTCVQCICDDFQSSRAPFCSSRHHGENVKGLLTDVFTLGVASIFAIWWRYCVTVDEALSSFTFLVTVAKQ